MNLQALGAAVRTLRGMRGLSIVELATKAGVHPNTVQQLEAGDKDNITLETVASIARVLAVPVEDLVRTR
jgi:transcriptional regulator with XRE-family HTH domain